MNNLAEVCLVGLGVGGNYAKCMVILITYICSVTMQALSEAIIQSGLIGLTRIL